MKTIRPWQFFSLLPGTNPLERLVTIPIPFRKGQETLTILTLDTLLLITAAKYLRARTLLEFGTATGATALNLAHNLPGTMIHCVDIERRPRDYDGTIFSAQIVEHTIAIEEFTAQPADLVFHDINYSRATIQAGTGKAFACEPKCIAWHDYGHPQQPHVKEFLDELTVPLYHVEDSLMVFWFRGPVELP